MEQKNKFDKYVATNRTDGKFLIDYSKSGKIENKDVELHVCKVCLKAMLMERTLYENFDFQGFINKYQNKQNVKKTKYTPETYPTSEYTADFNKISTKYRTDRNWTCEKCRLDCSSHHHLLDTHHKSGVKGDNNSFNLQALCKLCHKNLHNHYYVNKQDENLIIKLRKEQTL